MVIDKKCRNPVREEQKVQTIGVVCCYHSIIHIYTTYYVMLQMSHTNMHVIFNDQTTATGSTIIEDIAEMTADNTNWPDHAGTPRVSSS